MNNKTKYLMFFTDSRLTWKFDSLESMVDQLDSEDALNAPMFFDWNSDQDYSFQAVSATGLPCIVSMA